MKQKQNPAELLDIIYETQQACVELLKRNDKERDALIPPEIKERLRQYDEDFDTEIYPYTQKIEELTEQVKSMVLEAGETVHGKYLMAVYMNGRVTWDTAKLDGMAIILPEILKARKEGEPSVQIRNKK